MFVSCLSYSSQSKLKELQKERKL